MDLGFTLTNHQVLVAIQVIVFTIIIALSAHFLKNIIKLVRTIVSNRVIYKRQMAEVKQLKESGGYHEWVEIPISGIVKHVCKKTGYCPSMDAFIKPEYIERYLAFKKTREDYQLFQDKKIDEICNRYNIERNKFNEFISDINSIELEFLKEQEDANNKKVIQ